MTVWFMILYFGFKSGAVTLGPFPSKEACWDAVAQAEEQLWPTKPWAKACVSTPQSEHSER